MQNFGLDIRDKVLLFDFDGTLVVTEVLAQRVIEQYFLDKNYRYRAPKESIIGRTWQAAIESMHIDATSAGFQLDPPETMHTDFKERYLHLLKGGVDVVPGFLDCLPIFRQQCKFMGIVTGSDHHEVEIIMKNHGMENVFDRIWAYGDYEKSKPDPSPYLTALKDLNANPDDVIVFEDSVAGMESAHQAGLKFIQICYEAHSKKRDVRAMKSIEQWSEFLKHNA